MKKWLLPVRLMVLFLAFLSLSASFTWVNGNFFAWLMQGRNFLLIWGSAGVTYWLLKRVFLSSLRWEHLLITTFILFLLFDSLTPWWVFLLAGVLSQGIERLVRIPGGPLFNPAGASAFLLALFGFFPSWWGTNFPPRLAIIPEGMSLAFFFTLLAAGSIAFRYKKQWIIFSTLIVFAFTEWLIGTGNLLFILLDGTFSFFLLVMAVEPKTSPNAREDQLLYGTLIGALIPIGTRLHSPDAYLSALLLANVFTARGFLREKFFSKKNTSSTPPPHPTAGGEEV